MNQEKMTHHVKIMYQANLKNPLKMIMNPAIHLLLQYQMMMMKTSLKSVQSAQKG